MKHVQSIVLTDWVFCGPQLLQAAPPGTGCGRAHPIKATARRCMRWHMTPRTASWPARARMAPSSPGTLVAESPTGRSSAQQLRHSSGALAIERLSGGFRGCLCQHAFLNLRHESAWKEVLSPCSGMLAPQDPQLHPIGAILQAVSYEAPGPTRAVPNSRNDVRRGLMSPVTGCRAKQEAATGA